MKLKNKFLIIFFATNFFIAQSLQAMEWIGIAKIATPFIFVIGAGALVLKERFTSMYDLKNRISEVKAEVGEAKEEVKAEIGKLQNDFTKMMTDIGTLKQEFFAVQANMEFGFAEAREARAEMNNKLIAMNGALEVAQELLTKLGASSDEVKAMVAAFQLQLDEFKKQMAEFKTSFAELDAKIAQLPTKEAMQEAVEQAINPFHAQLHQVAQRQEEIHRQNVAFQKRLETQLSAQRQDIVHNITQVPSLILTQISDSRRGIGNGNSTSL